MKLAGIGVLLAGVAALFSAALWGPQAGLAAAAFGLLATAIHLAAVFALRRVWHGEFKNVMRAWAVGMGLRLAGATLWITTALLVPDQFPPLASAVGFLAVLLPLLFTEIRFLK